MSGISYANIDLSGLQDRVSASNSAAAQRYEDRLEFAEKLQKLSDQLDSQRVETSVRQWVKPTTSYFMEVTGLDYKTATSILSGVTGSKDTRDWHAIMTSDDPLTAARQATAAMYGIDGSRTMQAPRPPAGDQVLARSGALTADFNVSVDDDKIRQSKVGVSIYDAEGNLRRRAGSDSGDIARNAWLYGVSDAPLTDLADKVDAVQPSLATNVREAASLIKDPQFVERLKEGGRIVLGNTAGAATGATTDNSADTTTDATTDATTGASGSGGTADRFIELLLAQLMRQSAS